jgi:hypothetical protein
MSQPVIGIAAELVRGIVGSVESWVRRPRPLSGLSARYAKYEELLRRLRRRKTKSRWWLSRAKF